MTETASEYIVSPNWDRKKDETPPVVTPELIAWNEKLRLVPDRSELPELDMADIKLTVVSRAECLLNRNRRHGKVTFIIDQYNRSVLHALTLYFCGHPDFEKLQDEFGNNYSLDKGIFLCGEVGRGKSFMLSLFCNNPAFADKLQFPNQKLTNKSYINCLSIQHEYQRDGAKAMARFMKFHRQPENKAEFVFNDFGLEEKANNYGNKSMVMEEILTDRYELFTEWGVKTHMDSNLMDGDQIQNKYGQRIRSRMREMFNTIYLDGDDRRK